MSIEDYKYGKVSPMDNKKTGEPDLPIEKAKLVTKAIRRIGLEKEGQIFDDGENTNEIKKKESYADLYKGFSLDILNIRAKVSKYNDANDVAMKNAIAEDIIYLSEVVKNEILKQIEISKDPNEKADFDNFRLELESVTKNIVNSSFDKMVVNE